MSTENLSLEKKRKIKEKIEVLRQDTRNVDLWLELETLFDDPDKKREILMGVLVIDAQNSEALDRLSQLTGTEGSSFAVPDLPERPMTKQSFPSEKEKTVANGNDGWRLEDPTLTLEGDEDEEEATRKCPYCGELISVDAVKCRFCLEHLEEYIQDGDKSVSPQKEEAEFSGWLKTAIILFIVLGVITVLAMFIWMIFPLL